MAAGMTSSDKSSSTSSLSEPKRSRGANKHYIGKGNVVFTGPDGNSDYRAKILSPDCIGIGKAAVEHTGNLSYLWRAPKNTPHPRPRSCLIGEIGWHSRGHMDRRLLQSRQQITLGEFRSQCEDRFTHRYQNPWYPNKSRPKSQPVNWLRDEIQDELRQVPIRQTSSARSTIGPLPIKAYRRRPISPSSSSSSSCRISNHPF